MAKISPEKFISLFYIFLPVLYLKFLGFAFFRTAGRRVRIDPVIFERENDA